MKKFLLLLAMMLAMPVSGAWALQIADYYIGSTYNNIYSVVNGSGTVEGGGSVRPTKLNGKAMPYDYCVDLFTVVYVPADYSKSLVTRDGTIRNGQYVNNYRQVAWLLDNYATKSISDTSMQIALQAAIWEEINGYSKYHLDTAHYGTTSTVTNDYDAMLAGLANGPIGNVSDYYWITPIDSNGRTYQAQVTAAPVPEPSTFLLVGAGFAGIGIWRRRRK